MNALAAFWAVSFLLVITPGADWAYVISAGLRGRRLVLPAVVGLACGALLATGAVAAGVGALVARHPVVLTVLTLAGAAYLLWMGVGMWRSTLPGSADPDTAEADGTGDTGGMNDTGGACAADGAACLASALPAPASEPVHTVDARWRWVVKGAGVSGLNPKLILLLLALLPQFVRPSDPWSVGAQILALGAVHAVSCCFVYFGVGVASQRVLGARPAAARVVTRTSGVLMVLIAVLLLAEQALA